MKSNIEMTKACISKTKRAAKIWTLTEAICLSDRKSVRILLELQTPIGLLEQFVDSLQILDWRSWKNIKSIPSYNKVVNFIYSEKATKFCKYKFTKIKIKSFVCLNSIRNYEKNNAWNIRRLVDESFVLANQLIIL